MGLFDLPTYYIIETTSYIIKIRRLCLFDFLKNFCLPLSKIPLCILAVSNRFKSSLITLLLSIETDVTRRSGLVTLLLLITLSTLVGLSGLFLITQLQVIPYQS